MTDLGKISIAYFSMEIAANAEFPNMTYLALRCSRYINGVAMRHGELYKRGLLPTLIL